MVFLLIAVALLCGASAFGKEKEVTFVSDETSWTERVRLPFFTVARVVFFHGGDYARYCEKYFLGNEEECLRSLNGQFYDDLVSFAERMETPPVDAEAEITKEGFLYRDGIAGRSVDREKLFADALASLQTGREVTVVFLPVEPTVGKEELLSRTVLISSYRTDYASSAEGRKKNVRLACEKIDCATVLPGASFSFNERVGKRTKENGFCPAKIIVDGAFIEGVGGGVCQVSTTLFDAWLSAGLKVERAAAHSLPVSYVAPSLDAMVSDGSDLVLKNDGAYPVYLRAYADGKKIKIEVYGAPSGYEVKLRSVTHELTDCLVHGVNKLLGTRVCVLV